MKILQIVLSLVLFITATPLSHAQDFPVPANYILKAEEDYKKYEQELMATITWLEKQPINEYQEERKVANVFMMAWLTGSPYVTIELHGGVLTFSAKNADLLVTFMGGWTKYALANPEAADDLTAANLAGLESVIEVYQLNKGNGMKKDKAVEKLIALQKDGKLKQWVKDQLKE